VRINTNPAGASVWLNGANTGQMTPCELANLAPGTHNIRLIKDGFVTVDEAVLVGDQVVTLDRPMIINQYRLILEVQPPTAQYWLTDRDNAVEVATGLVTDPVPMLDGQRYYILVVEAEGYRRQQQIIEPSYLPERPIQIALVAMPGTQTPVPGSTASVEQPVANNGSEQNTATTQTEGSRDTTREDAATQRQIQREEEDRQRRQREREERERADREAREQATRTPGTISIMSVPAAEVFIDGESIGFTPVRNREINAGRHVLRLVNDQFNMDYTENVNITSGESQTVRHRQE
jgi:hypothetical protein